MTNTNKYFSESENEESDNEEVEADNEESEHSEYSEDSEMMDTTDFKYEVIKEAIKDAIKEVKYEVKVKAEIEEPVTSEKLIMNLRNFYFEMEKCKNMGLIDKKIMYSICNEIMRKC